MKLLKKIHHGVRGRNSPTPPNISRFNLSRPLPFPATHSNVPPFEYEEPAYQTVRKRFGGSMDNILEDKPSFQTFRENRERTHSLPDAPEIPLRKTPELPPQMMRNNLLGNPIQSNWKKAIASVQTAIKNEQPVLV